MSELQPASENGLASISDRSGVLVVGLGASAGGIQALKEFFENVPADSGLAYVVILHLSPDHDSRLASVLQTVTQIPVTQVTKQVKVEPNHVYVLPPNQHLEMMDDRIVVSPNTLIEELRAPVDIFFRTLAESHDSRAVAVILSGMGANGSMGLKRVKERGGVCFVQNPREAEFNEMPRNAIATELVDDVLPVAEIPQKIIAYKESLGSVEIQVEPEKRSDEQQQALREIFTHLRVRTGHDFSNYKRSTVLRRIERRINVRQLLDLPAYAKFLRENTNEPQALLKDLLISVTDFFRDQKAFEALERDVLPHIIHGRRADEQVRVWVASCATGEEAYSIAMLLAERTLGIPDAPKVQIFATDIDEAAITRAREGLYSINDAADVTPERLRRFFTKEGDNYRVRRELREMVLFAVHNLIKDPPFSHLDLATCRNLLIYLNSTAQERVLETLHFALNPGRFLFIGSSEPVEGAGDLFVPVNKGLGIYQAREAAARSLPVSDVSPSFHFKPKHSAIAQTEQVEMRARERIAYSDLHQQLLEQYAPPSIVVNEEYDILHLSERAGRYLQITGGEPSKNLLKLIRPELRLELRTALYQATQRRTNVEAKNLKVRIDECIETINVQVRPVLRETDTARGFILVLFAQAQEAKDVAAAEVIVASSEPMALQLEEELMRTKTQLRALSEQNEVQIEELRASNEELQAINEELRSTAEELETSTEELQSVNEELQTVNQELKIKLEELSLSSSNLQNLINSTDIATIFLDRSLRVQLFTPAAKAIFNFIPADFGRPLSDITHHLEYANLIADAEAVLDELKTIEREVQTTDGRSFLTCVLPYRTADSRIDGVVVTFIDITQRRRAEERLRESEAHLQAVANLVPDLLWSNDLTGKTDWYNQGWREYAGLTSDEAIDYDWLDAIHPEDRENSRRNFQTAIDTGEPLRQEYRIRNAAGEYRWFLVQARPLKDEAGKILRWFGAATDVHEHRTTLDALRESEERLRLLIESASDYAIFTMTLDNRIASWNKGAEKVFGWTENEALGQSGEIIFTPEDRAAGKPEKEINTALREGRSPDERFHLRKDGTRFYVSGVMSLLRDAEGNAEGFVKIARDMSEQRRAEEALRRAHEGLETRVRERTIELAQANESLQAEIIERRQVEEERVRLLRQLVSAQEDERRRVARDIHDQLGQQSTALALTLESLKAGCGKERGMREKIEQAQAIARRLDSDVEFLAWELRPASLDDLGLPAALANYIKEWSKHFGIKARFHAYPPHIEAEDRLAPEIEINLYRIAQEALNNVNKHARAKYVDVIFERRDDSTLLIIEDDGAGFDLNDESLAQRGVGLIGMRERAALIGGTIEIESAPDKGTTIFARVPASFVNEGEAPR
jgi:two-component system CheB/CheR fusion protein